MLFPAKGKVLCAEQNTTPWRYIHRLIKHQAMKTYWGSGDTAPRILNLNIIRGCIQKFPDWVDNELYAYNNKNSLRSNEKGYGGKTH
jgi:hypothetical protein